jgi:DNA adenine methylase
VKAPIAYYGGKTGLALRIIDLMPPHRVYIEPFFGSGAVFFAKPPATHEILNDLDGNVVCFFRMLRDRPEDLERVCALTPYAREEYELAGEETDVDDLERARRFWVRVNQGFSRTGGRTGWSATTARTQSTAMAALGRIGRFSPAASRMARASWECCDAVDLVDRLATPDAVIYADPPYLATTRRGGTRGRARGRAEDYRHDMGRPEDHERLAEVLRATSATVLLSGYPSPLYEALYADWWHVDWLVNVHASNAVTAARGKRIERLWSNRALDEGRLAFGAEATP